MSKVHATVANPPCGVETFNHFQQFFHIFTLLIHRVELKLQRRKGITNKILKLLIHRVELKHNGNFFYYWRRWLLLIHRVELKLRASVVNAVEPIT